MLKDSRPRSIRRTLDGVLESLDATIQVRRWSAAEPVPDTLRSVAARLLEHLGAAERLMSREFRGTPQDEKRVVSMTRAIKKLDTAFVAFRRSLERAPTEADAASQVLASEIEQVQQTNDDWAAP